MKRPFTILIIALLFQLVLTAQTNVLTPYNILNIKNVSAVEISPDLNYAAYTLNIPRSFSDKPGGEYRELHLINLTDRSSRPLIEGMVNINSINWYILRAFKNSFI